MSERDLFANFERMRREMDELFGNVFDRGLAPRRRGGFSPAVDVYYVGDPPRAVVRADLAGIDPGDVDLEIRGRELILAGHRRPSEDQERLYQQLEIEHGPFRRVVALGAEVDADAAKAVYEDGMLVVELPVVGPADAHTVPIEPGRRSAASAETAASRDASTSRPSATAGAPWRWAHPRCRRSCPSCRCATRSPSPTR